jgi:hypothetical protein
MFKRIQAVRDAAASAGVACDAHTVEALHPWEAIIEHAQRSPAAAPPGSLGAYLLLQHRHG